MNALEQEMWLTDHIPHRLRAACARLDLQNTLLNASLFIDPAISTNKHTVIWQCSTDSIWEGRLAAMRWLIEFVGIQLDKNGVAIKRPKKANDVAIDDFAGGVELKPNTADGEFLAKVWKGCTQASSHATNAYGHPSVDDRTVLPKAVGIVLDHLQATIYGRAGKNLRDCVLSPPFP
jgi:hypothetical protein